MSYPRAKRVQIGHGEKYRRWFLVPNDATPTNDHGSIGRDDMFTLAVYAKNSSAFGGKIFVAFGKDGSRIIEITPEVAAAMAKAFMEARAVATLDDREDRL